MDKLIVKLQHKYALSRKGAKDMIKATFACVLFNFANILPISLLFALVSDLLNGVPLENHLTFFVVGTIICIALIVLTIWFQYNATFFTTYVESGVRRVSLAERLRKLPLSFFGKKDLADLTSTIMADCAKIETASSHWIPELFGALISTALMAASMFFFDWRMSLAAVGVLPVSFAIVLFSSKVQNKVQRIQNKTKMDCADGIQECLETIRDLRSNNAEETYLDGLDIKIDKVEKRTIVSELTLAAFVTSSQMILRVGIGLTALVGSILLTEGTLNVAMMFMFLLVVSRLYDPMIASLQNLAAVISTEIQCERMDEILSHDIQTGEEKLSNKGYDIEFKDVDFAYDTSERVLNGVSFTAKQGEVTALIGPSGGGKTTASRLASRFWDIDKGQITVGGMDISKIDPETLMKLYSIVFQNVTLFNNTVMENIRLGRQSATDEEVIAAAKLAHVDEFAERMPQKYNTMIGENGSELSGGERQRISIARAFLKDAPVVLLDEATASLDVENETLIQESISKLIRNKTVMIIAHRMRTVAGANKIVVLKDGTVAQQGDPSELINQEGIYRNMVETQTKSTSWKL